MLKLFPLLFALVTANLAEASILPKNDLHKYDNPMKIANLTEAEFNAAIDEFAALWQPIAMSYNGRLEAQRNWSDSTVNAYADRSGSNWSIQMFGGLARRDEITLDAFKLVVCHELGHLFGGYHFGYYAGMTSEGGADYFATQLCARQVWEAEVDVSATFRGTANPTVRRECDAAWSTENEQNMCYRTAAAGASLSNLFAALRGEENLPQHDTPDPAEVAQTQTFHPATQCRMDTYFQGALCTRRADPTTIPGYDGVGGENTIDTERLANANSCSVADGYERGNRPRCWFKPLIETRN